MLVVERLREAVLRAEGLHEVRVVGAFSHVGPVGTLLIAALRFIPGFAVMCPLTGLLLTGDWA